MTDAFLDVLSNGTGPVRVLLKPQAICPLENLMKTMRLCRNVHVTKSGTQ